MLQSSAEAQAVVPQDSVPTSAQDASIPTLRGGSLAFESELARTNYLNTGVSIGTAFDDNTLSTSSDHTSDFGYSVLPYIGLKQSRGRLKWTLDYAAGFTVNQQLSNRNQGSHNLGIESEYQLSPHVNLVVRDHFLKTTGFFDQMNRAYDGASGTILQTPNQAVITPLANETSNSATAEITYQFGRDSQIGGSGTFYLSHYNDAPAGTALIDSNTQEVEAFYNHRLFDRDSIGVTYRFLRLTFSPVFNNVLVHSVLATYSFRPRPNLSLSFFVGPQYTNTQSELIAYTMQLPVVFLSAIPISQTSWSPAVGGSFSWNGQRTSFVTDASRMINDGGGLLGAVHFTTFGAAVRRQLSRDYTARMGVVYGLSNQVGSSALSYSSLKSATGNFSLSRRIGTNFGLTLGYARDYQLDNAPGSSNINHNRAWITISYEFSRPMGR
jgi:hypothetical protein